MNPPLLVKTYIVENFLFGDDKDLCHNQSLIDQGVIDSTGVLELVVFIEETFKIKILDEEMIPENLESITKICSYIERKTKQRPTQTSPDTSSSH